MPTDPEPLDAHAMEAALPTLANKLQELKNGLNESERAVLSSIINSAALHLKSIQAIEPTAEVRYAKPISAAASVAVRKGLLDLPSRLGLDE